MEQIIRIFGTLVLGYLLGSINTSIIIGRVYGVDIREHGSGNAGMTNAIRTLGKVAGISVIFGDVLKGILACYLGLELFKNIPDMGNLGAMIAGIGAILGHNWPLYFGFKGGKGILTTFAVMLFLSWQIGLILFGIFFIIVYFTRYISLGSIVGSALFPLVAFFVYDGPKNDIFVLLAGLLGAIAIIRHNENIERLINGTENKFSFKSKKKIDKKDFGIPSGEESDLMLEKELENIGLELELGLETKDFSQEFDNK